MARQDPKVASPSGHGAVAADKRCGGRGNGRGCGGGRAEADALVEGLKVLRVWSLLCEAMNAPKGSHATPYGKIKDIRSVSLRLN